MTVFRFGECEIDDSRRRLRVTGEERHVEPGVFDLLLILANRGDTIVTRDELIESVWKGRTVSDSAISVRVNAARRAVDDDGRRQSCNGQMGTQKVMTRSLST